jgi:peptidase E
VYALAEHVFQHDPELRLAHRRRQAQLHELQEIYRLRLAHAKDAARALFEHEGDPEVVRPARRQAIAALRRLDHSHLHAIRRSHAHFEAQYRPAERPPVREAAERLRERIAGAEAVFIAGGHVAVLLNRLRLLGGAALLQDKPVVAWSAGAMIASEAVVLFHDQPPQGRGNVEVFDAGLGLVRRTVVFPHASTRLRLDQPRRVALLARRFAPAACVTLDEGAQLHFVDDRLEASRGTQQLARQGTLTELAAA